MSKTMAAVVTQRSRGTLALTALLSLRSQVDLLCLYANHYSAPPDWLPEGLVDHVQCDPDNTAGDTGNLFWADKHDGLYFSCDDDLEYHKDYASILGMWVEKFGGQAICTTHGLRFKPETKVWKTTEQPPVSSVIYKGKRVPVAARTVVGWEFRARWDNPVYHAEWIHQPGSGVMALDTRVVRLPSHWPEVNNADLLVALWAYQHRVPVCLIPHSGWECADILPKDADSLWKQHKADGFSRRNELVQLADWKECFKPAPAIAS